MKVFLKFWLLFLGATACPADDFSRLVEPFLATHCYDCHGPDKQKAELRYDRIDDFRAEDTHLWTKIYEQLLAGEMPPDDRPRPAASDLETVLNWIETEQRALTAGSTRRLNRRELTAALQDVTGLSVDYSMTLPGDGKVAGFDTGIEGLQDAGDSVAQILEITRRAVEGIRFLEPAPAETLTANLRDAEKPKREADSWKKHDVRLNARTDAPGMGLLIDPQWIKVRGGQEIRIPHPPGQRGVLRLSFTVSVLKKFDGMPNPNLWVEVGSKTIDRFEVSGGLDNPHELSYDVQLEDVIIDPKKGLVIYLQNVVELPYAVKGFPNDDRSKPGEPPSGLWRPAYDQKKVPPLERPLPYVVLQKIEVDSLYKAPWPPEDWEVETGELSDSPETARRLLVIWTERAWRRPVSQDETERFFKLYEHLRAQGATFDEALRPAFQSVLMSAPFRYLSSPSDGEADLRQHTVASRLSFMLTGGPPDAELRRLANEGKLSNPKTLDAQVDRLLADPRSEHFWRPFVTQWLEMEQPITIAVEHLKRVENRFTRYLTESMRDETIGYVARLFEENRPAREFIDSDWTLMNEPLASHYGYDGIEGGHLRQVRLKPDDPRGGGILGHAGIQSMLTWMGDNWVIYRGAWTLRHILDDPPPVPPLEVPELDPAAGENRGKTFKELLAQHQEDANCSVCHQKMDPLGFAFQNFDLSGRWRELEYAKYQREELDGKVAWNGAGKSRPVDAVGRLPRGEEFTNYEEFKNLAVEHYLEDLVRGLLKNLVLYGTGRQADVADMAEIRRIMASEKTSGYRMKDVLKALVRSESFWDR